MTIYIYISVPLIELNISKGYQIHLVITGLVKQIKPHDEKLLNQILYFYSKNMSHPINTAF